MNRNIWKYVCVTQEHGWYRGLIRPLQEFSCKGFFYAQPRAEELSRKAGRAVSSGEGLSPTRLHAGVPRKYIREENLLKKFVE